jgi:hypothetical protein
MPSRPLPQVQSLQAAVNEVIVQPQGKPATRFISMTQNGTAPKSCARLHQYNYERPIPNPLLTCKTKLRAACHSC